MSPEFTIKSKSRILLTRVLLEDFMVSFLPSQSKTFKHSIISFFEWRTIQIITDCIVRNSADEKSKIFKTRVLPLRCVAANLKNEKFNCKLSVKNQLVSNTILDKKVDQNYNFIRRTIVLSIKQRFLIFYKNISFGEAPLEMVLQKTFQFWGLGLPPTSGKKSGAKI